MHDTGKKVGYLKGLLENADFGNPSTAAKLFSGVVDLLGDLSDRIDVVDEILDDLNDYVESIDDDLSVLEGSEPAASPFSYSDEDEEDDDFEDDFDHEDQLHLLRTEPRSEAAIQPLVPSICPECGRAFLVHLSSPSDARYACPHCSAVVPAVPLSPENAPIVNPVGDADI